MGLKYLIVVVCLMWSTVVTALTPAEIAEVKSATVFIGVYGETDTPKQLGSGFFITPSGLLVTNYHVIHRADTIRVWRYGELTYYTGIIVGIDPLADLALIQITPPTSSADEALKEIERHPFAFLEMEEEIDTIQPGTAVWAFGNPLSNRFVTTKGIITTDAMPGFLSPFVRQVIHDAVLNNGSSGGALLNAEGKVVGVNTYIMSPQGSYSGLGAATRSDTVTRSIRKMIKSNYIENEKPIVYPALDLHFLELDDMGTNEAVQRAFPAQKIPNTFGILLRQIEPESYPYENGLREFDTIISINGVPTNDRSQVADAIIDKEVGQEVYLTIIRRGVIMLVPYMLTASTFNYVAYYDKDRGVPKGKPLQPDK